MSPSGIFSVALLPIVGILLGRGVDCAPAHRRRAHPDGHWLLLDGDHELGYQSVPGRVGRAW